MTHFHLIRIKKHKILSIVVLNMAKYTIIPLIMTNLYLRQGFKKMKKIVEFSTKGLTLSGIGGVSKNFKPMLIFIFFLIGK